MIASKTITQQQADSIRAEAAIKQQTADVNKKSFFVNAAKQIQLSGYTQVRYQNLDEIGKIDGFDVRRARLGAKGNISPVWNYAIQFELAGTTKLLDAYAEAKIAEYFNITIGQSKIPLSLENITATNKLESIDFSQVVEALAARGKDVIGNHNGLDLGVQVGGSLLKIKELPLLDYKIGIFNGAGINVADNNESKDFGGRLVLHPIKGLDLGGTYYNGWANYGTPKATNKARNRIGFELSCEYKNASFKSEYIKGKDDKINREGYYAQLGYFIIPQKLQIITKYDYYDQNTSISEDIATNYILLLNYNFTPLARIQAGYYFRDKTQKGPQINNGYNMGVIQFQIGF